MSRTGVVLDDVFKRHDTGPGHPERPGRIDAIRVALERRGLADRLERIEVKRADMERVVRVHSAQYVMRLEAACRQGASFMDCGDSAICPESYEIALLAAGAVTEAARRIGRGELTRAFCAVRPPGHHCEYDESMGFCLLNNVAIAARTLQDEFGVERVAILDWDVHHGNGTQHLFESDANVLFISLHGHPKHLYPGTGYESEIGHGPGRGYTLNIPLMPGAGDGEYRAAFDEKVLPRLASFSPEVLIISAGFDAHEEDPLAEMLVTDGGFQRMTREAIAIANERCEGRILSVLEGGYHLDALGRCVADHVEALAGGT